MINEVARKIADKLKMHGYIVFYNETEDLQIQQATSSRGIPPMAQLEVKLGIPNVMPASAKGDVLIQVTYDLCRMTTDVVSVNESQFYKAILTCNSINTQAGMSTAALFDAESVVTVFYDFDWRYSNYEQVVLTHLSHHEQVVNNIYRILQVVL